MRRIRLSKKYVADRMEELNIATQKELAERMQMDRTQLNHLWVKDTNLQMATLARLAEALEEEQPGRLIEWERPGREAGISRFLDTKR